MSNHSHQQQLRLQRNLYHAIAEIQDLREARLFLADLCTPKELQALADRWEAVRLLKKNLPYREISQRTGMSVTTIGRVARSLTFGDGGYNTIFERTQVEVAA